VQGVGRRLAEPCAHLERVSGSGLLRPRSTAADVLVGATIRLDDELVPIED
jgi:hypothetical protein